MEYDNLIDEIVKESKDTKEMNTEEKKIDLEQNKTEQITEKKIDNEEKNIQNENQLIEDAIHADFQKKEIKEEKKKEEKEQLKERIPGIKNPIDFVEYFEVPSLEKRLLNMNNCFKLHEHILKGKINFNLLETETQNELYKIIVGKLKDNDITTLMTKKNNIGIGDKKGNVHLFDIQNKKKINYKIFKSPLSKTNFTQVTCLDLTDECDFLFVGYMNGAISMFEFLTGKNKFLSEKIHLEKDNNGMNPIIDIKVYNNEDNIYGIISCDSLGYVKVSIIKKEFIFMYRIIYCIDLIERNYLVYFVKTFNFSKLKYSEFNNIGNYSMIGDKESIKIFKMEPEIECICNLNKPKYLDKEIIPDASIGVGKPIERYTPFGYNIEPNNILLTTISWGNIIYIYKLLIKNKSINEGICIGHYINDSDILKIGFITNSIIYMYDKRNYLKILNTRKFQIGEFRKGNNENDIQTTNEIAELEQRIIDVKGPNYLQSFNNDNFKYLYNYSISENGNTLYLLGKNKVTNVKLLKWDLCLNSLQNKNEWKDLLSISIEIYQGMLTALSDIPENVNERKKIIGNNLRQIISQYVISETKNTNTTSFFFDDSVDNNKMNECIDTTIEFCIEIESFDYLIKELEPIFESKNYAELFLQNLEPYIFSDKIINFDLDEELILQIIELYVKRNGLDLLSQLLLHINIKSLDTDKIKKKLEELDLITPLIYLYMNGKEVNYFAPIHKLFDLYNNSTPLKDFTSYYLLKNVSIHEIFTSKQYIGHKLLWYLKILITGRKFPNSEEKIEDNKLKELIPKLTFWMLNDKNLKELCYFDAKDFFVILKNIFSIKKLFNILVDYADENKDNKITVMLLSNSIAQINDAQPEALIQYLITMIKSYKNDEILFYLYEFMAKISGIIELSKENIIEFTCFILKNYQRLNKDINRNEPIQLCKDLKSLFDCRYEFSEEEYKTFLRNCNDNIFDEMKLYFNQKLNDYSECLKIFINQNCGIEKREEYLFSWLNMTLTHFTMKKNKEKLKDLKEIIIENADKILQISIIKFKILIYTWFPKEKNDILFKISNPKYKLGYVELIIKDIKIQLNENELLEEDQLFIQEVLRIHIDLLCYLKLYDKILPSIKELGIYPYEEIIDTLEKYNVTDASVYVLLKTGDPRRAINICILNLNHYFSEIIKIFNGKSNENLYQINYDKFNENIELIYYICKNNEQNIEELWKMFLMELYSINEKLDKINDNKTERFINFDKYLSKTISDLLDIMCNYVSIIQIIDIVSKKYKDAELKEFKNLLLKMLESNGNQETILSNAKKLLKNNILLRKEIYKKENLQGIILSLYLCDECHKEFDKTKNTKEKIIAFKCGHILHDKCVIKENTNEGQIVICSICRKNEIESSINTQGLSLIKVDVNKNSSEIYDDDEEKEKYDYQVLRLFSQMKNIDNRHKEKKKIYLYE